MWGADWKFLREGNCSALRGLPSDAEQLSRVTEFSIRTQQLLQILFLAYSSFDNCIGAWICVILSIWRWSLYIFDQEMFGWAPIYDMYSEITKHIKLVPLKVSIDYLDPILLDVYKTSINMQGRCRLHTENDQFCDLASYTAGVHDCEFQTFAQDLHRSMSYFILYLYATDFLLTMLLNECGAKLLSLCIYVDDLEYMHLIGMLIWFSVACNLSLYSVFHFLLGWFYKIK